MLLTSLTGVAVAGPKGSEHMCLLSIENWWVGDLASDIMLTPFQRYIDA